MIALAGWLLFVALSLSSLYVFPSGQPQPADFLLLGFATLMLLAALGSDERLAGNAFALCWGLLVLWISMVCLAWTLIMQSSGFYMHMLFFQFNFLVGMGLMRLLAVGDARMLGLIRAGVAIAMLVAGSQALVQLAAGSIRTTGSFNNPNQLAYFALCGVVVLLLVDDFRPRLRPLPLLGLAAGVVCIFAASSLAAMGGLALVTLGWVIANVAQLKHAARLLLLVPLLVLALVAVDLHSAGQVQHNVLSRMDRASTKIDSMVEERKFDRLLNFPEYAILGAGEGERRRFIPYHRNEIHSSYINMLFAYGVPGLTLFAAVLWTALYRAPLYVWAGVSGPLLYAFTHNGLRSTLFWLLLVLCWQLYGRYRGLRSASHASAAFPAGQLTERHWQ